MKACTTCSVVKPLPDFQIRRASADGRTASCRSCLRVRDANRESHKRAAARSAYLKTDSGKRSHHRANDAYRLRRRDRYTARNQVTAAVRDGKLQPWPFCAVPECDTPKPEAHHPDYSRPLDVVWLCDPCHKGAHRTARLLSRLIN